MDQEQLPVQVRGRLSRRCALVAFGIVLREHHVTLGVDRVVLSPIDDAAAGDTHGIARAMGQRVRGHEAAVAPAIQPHACRVRPRLGLEPAQALLHISELGFTKPLVCDPRRLHAFAARRSVIAHPHDDAPLREQLVIQPGRAGPRILDRLRHRTRVRVLIHRMLAGSIEIRRLDHHGLEHESVFRRDVDEFGRREAVVLQRRHLTGIDDADRRSVGIVETNLRRRGDVTPGVDVLRALRIEDSRMRAVARREPLQARAIE